MRTLQLCLMLALRCCTIGCGHFEGCTAHDGHTKCHPRLLYPALLLWMHRGGLQWLHKATPLTSASCLQAAAVLDHVARTVLPLLLQGMGLRADALSGALDDTNLPSTIMSSSELHVARYRPVPSPVGPVDGEEPLSSSAVLLRHSIACI